MSDQDESTHPPNMDSRTPILSETPPTMSPPTSSINAESNPDSYYIPNPYSSFLANPALHAILNARQRARDPDDPWARLIPGARERTGEGAGMHVKTVRPYKVALVQADVDSCVVLENSCFSPELAASREKITYRIKKASGLCIGLFTTISPDQDWAKFPTFETSRSAEAASERRSVLIAQILVTMTTNRTVTEDDMAIPADWDVPKPSGDAKLGHKPEGRTVALHSLAVLPEVQGRTFGSVILRSFVDMVKEARIADRIALLADTNIVDFYERNGFTKCGVSSCRYGGQEWFDMVRDFGEEDGSEAS